MQEIWLPYPHDDGFLVGETGRVLSLPKRTRSFALELTPTVNKESGYVVIGMRSRMYYLHRIVAITFLDNPDGLPEVNHKDGDKLNNHVGNLEWVSRKGNAEHASKMGLMAHSGRAGNSKLVAQDIPKIRARLATGEPQHRIARDFGVGQGVISRINTGKLWNKVIGVED